MQSTRHIITEMTAADAQTFLLKHESYFSLDLPDYFDFSRLLDQVSEHLRESPTIVDALHAKDTTKAARAIEGVNHTIYTNRDGQYSWRPLELINPVLYVDLVATITQPEHWDSICNRFSEFQSIPHITCLSYPAESRTTETDQAEQIRHWERRVEQASIELALEFQYMVHTDVMSCYASIYTHSISWALHTKSVAKACRFDPTLVGNLIDQRIQDIREGQTNGIPQGSLLMDFVAEMILGYADLELSNALSRHQIGNFRILRYRDDYRIFVDSKEDGSTILKYLAEVMIGLGLQLRPEKTEISDDIIHASLKGDKMAWIMRRNFDKDPKKQLLIIYNHSREHPNAGSVVKALDAFYKREGAIDNAHADDVLQLISSIVVIAFRNPRTIPICSAILSKLLSRLEDPNAKAAVFAKTSAMFSRIPNTGHLDIWLQRMRYAIDRSGDFREPLCKLVQGNHGPLWDSTWVPDNALRVILDSADIVDRDKLDEKGPIISIDEVSLFKSVY